VSEKDWARELAKIDKQLESISDDALLPAKPVPAGAPPAAKVQAKAEAAAVQSRTTTLGVMARLVLAIALGIGVMFWPYEARCGLGLAAYLGAVAVVAVGGVWSAVWSWRHRAGRAHVLSLLLVLWGLILAGMDVLPRVGYAKVASGEAAVWRCS
jgi:hypothetical protein